MNLCTYTYTAVMTPANPFKTPAGAYYFMC